RIESAYRQFVNLHVPNAEHLHLIVDIDDRDRRAAIFLFPRLSVRRGPRRCRQRSRVESSMGDCDGLKPGRIRIWISEVYAQSHAIERAWIDAGALFEFIDF